MLPLSLVLFVTLLAARCSALLNVTTKNGTSSYETMDFFQSNFPYYLLPSAYPLQLSPTSDSSTCQFGSDQLKSGHPPSNIANYSSTIILLNANAPVAAGCMTITAATVAALDFNSTLVTAGYPSIGAIILFSTPPSGKDAIIGGPYTERYVTHNTAVPDSVPRIPTALMQAPDFASIVTTILKANNTFYLVLEQDVGPWNRVFQSSSFSAYTWILFTLNICLVIYASWRLLLLSLHGHFTFDLRTAIFLVGLVSSVLIVVMIPMRRQTYAYYLLQQVATFLFSCSFYLLLLLWSGVLSRVQVDRSFAPFRLMIYFCVFTSLYTMVLELIRMNIWQGKGIDTARSISRVWTPASQAGIAILFFVYAVRFNLRRHDYNASKDTRRALTKLAKLSIAGFTSFIMVAVINILTGEDSMIGVVSVVTGALITIDISSLLRAAAILLVLDVKLPSGSTTGGSGYNSSQGYAGGTTTGSGWGAWSRGWRRALMRSDPTHTSATTTHMPDRYYQSRTGHGLDTSYGGQSTGNPEFYRSAAGATTTQHTTYNDHPRDSTDSASTTDEYEPHNPNRTYLR